MEQQTGIRQPSAPWVGYNSIPDKIKKRIMNIEVKVTCNPSALRMAKTVWSFGYSECNRVNLAIRWRFPYQN